MSVSSKESLGMEVEVRKQQQQVDVFKKPLHPPPHRKKKILDEETYVREMERIIERDFFPDLDNLKERMEYIEAKESNNVMKLRALFKKYAMEGNSSTLRNIENSPATFETPAEMKGDATPASHAPQEDAEVEGEGAEEAEGTSKEKRVSLDDFLSRHTSEDNESFEEIMKENERRFRQKHAWMFEAEEKHNTDHTPNLALPTPEEQVQASVLAITGTSLERDTRPKSLENWKFNTFNSVMFVPDGVEMSRNELMEHRKQKKQSITLENTRFDGNPFTETMSAAAMLEASAVQAIKKEGKVGVDGRELGKETPKVNGYSFVTAPSPMPGVDASPLMTWGEVEGTPCQLDGSQTPLLKRHTQGPSYRIPQLPSRDRIGHRLSEQASQKHRNKKQKAVLAAKQGLQSPLVKYSSGQTAQERLMSMSPAAQKLLKSKVRLTHGADKSLLASYTPSPSTRSAATPSTPGSLTPALANVPTTSSSSRSRGATPRVRTKRSGVHTSEEGDLMSGLTDNLLDLRKRQKFKAKEGSASLQSDQGGGSGSSGGSSGGGSSGDDEANGRRCAADFF